MSDAFYISSFFLNSLTLLYDIDQLIVFDALYPGPDYMNTRPRAKS